MKSTLIIFFAMGLDVYLYWQALEMRYTPTKWWFKWLPISGLFLFVWNYRLCTTPSDAGVKDE